MYVSTSRPEVVGRAGAVPATVVGLGVVSLITDISAEMVTAVLPLYLVYGVGVGFLHLGVVEGLYAGSTALLRLLGGYCADRLGRPKAVAAVGYGLSAVTKLGLPAAGGSIAGIGAVLAIDRAGKGIRTGPRDAMITLATPADQLGRAFGVHRAMDTAGALLGPLVAVALITAFTGFDTVFVTSFCLGVVGLLVLVFFVDAPATAAPAKESVSPRKALAALAGVGPRRVCLAAGLLGLVTVGDMVLYVVIQQRGELPTAVLPLLPLGTAVTFLLAAAPVGRLADRVGRWRVFLAGHGLLLAAYLLVGFSSVGWATAAAALALHGLFYAGTDGVLMAHVGPLIPAELRSTGLAAVQTVQALARAGGAVAVGAALHFGTPQAAFGVLAALLGVAIAAGVRLGRTR
ncbi:Major Facilitator Superfamily protein [Actinokineospora alba]|uniref:Major Facilitator Superfamily protein n=1 Tax=Actinokineospora alba TaxID=504798 RepID=A0A1H0EZM3_9PSEU|nr:MFS transporter [Actinokineospora alba]TDP69285.1 MFS transporter [Actinokineospora alba]SDI20240.1 Major Facilitator Superfamily protein [Actinokineospora alba]SDN87785.1 Major Facilitator Superfamily protein [Actinokineospora alba]